MTIPELGWNNNAYAAVSILSREHFTNWFDWSQFKLGWAGWSEGLTEQGWSLANLALASTYGFPQDVALANAMSHTFPQLPYSPQLPNSSYNTNSTPANEIENTGGVSMDTNTLLMLMMMQGGGRGNDTMMLVMLMLMQQQQARQNGTA